VFWGLNSWFFCNKLRHTKEGRDGVFCSFVVAVEGQGETERGGKSKTSLLVGHERTEREPFLL
jgi:hypothetical protein